MLVRGYVAGCTCVIDLNFESSEWVVLSCQCGTCKGSGESKSLASSIFGCNIGPITALLSLPASLFLSLLFIRALQLEMTCLAAFPAFNAVP
jgi:hypothetical protein